MLKANPTIDTHMKQHMRICYFFSLTGPELQNLYSFEEYLKNFNAS